MIFEGCEKVARGRTNFCASHGGAQRCKENGCTRVAMGNQLVSLSFVAAAACWALDVKQLLTK